MVISACKWFLTGLLVLLQGEWSGLNALNHPFFVSVTEVNYNAGEKTLEISCKFFTNDLEKTLEKVAGNKVDLSDPKTKEQNEQLITSYVNKHMQIKTDGRPAALQFIGTEKESDGTWCYFQSVKQEPFKRIDMMNNLLYESFDSEINIVHVTNNNIRKSTKLSSPDTNLFFEW